MSELCAKSSVSMRYLSARTAVAGGSFRIAVRSARKGKKGTCEMSIAGSAQGPDWLI